jgi:hypothetical protein
MDFDVCSVLKSGKVQLHPIVGPNNLKTIYDGKCDFISYLQARSREIDSEVVAIRISWDGTWHEGIKEMPNHFKIGIKK